MGSLSSTGLNGRLGLQWSQLPTPNGPLVKNNFSEQEFQTFSIPNLQLNNIKLYFCRQISSLPKTPKIICLEKHPDRLLILVEKADKSLTQWLSQIHCELSVLLKLKDALSALHALKSKFGPFLVTQKMLKVSPNDNLLVWYNQRYESNLIQLPLLSEQSKGQNEQIMLHNLVEIFKKSHAQLFDISLLIPQSRTLIQFKKKVKQRIQQIESLLGSNSQSQKSNNPKGSVKRSLTPDLQHSQKLINLSSLKHFSQIQKPKKQRKSDHATQNDTLTRKQTKTTHPLRSRPKLKFLEDPTPRDKQKSIGIKQPAKWKISSSLEEQSSSSPSYSSSNISSQEIANQSCYQDGKSSNFSKKQLDSLNVNEKLISPQKQKQKPFPLKTFKKKQHQFSNYIITDDQKHPYVMRIKMSPSKSSQQPTTLSQQRTSQKPIQPSSLYKGCDSFSSRKNFSLKSTTGTLKKTRQFQQNIRQLLQHHHTIKEESDETHKNSQSYSVESIKEELKEEMKASASLSQDFNKLFSMAESIASGMEDSMREKEFERILFQNPM